MKRTLKNTNEPTFKATFQRQNIATLNRIYSNFEEAELFKKKNYSFIPLVKNYGTTYSSTLNGFPGFEFGFAGM